MNRSYLELRIFFEDSAPMCVQFHQLGYTALRFESLDDLLKFREEFLRLVNVVDESLFSPCNPSVQEVESSPDRGLARRVLSDVPV